jgi:Zn-dependent protease
MILISLLIWLIAVTIAITIHEFSHALISDKLGDPTARLQGRLSLNPLSHYDQVGTTMLLVTSFMRALGAPIMPLGWAKPVEYDPYNLAHPKRDAALIALAGPASNLIIATIIAFLLRTFFMELPLASILASAVITLNVSLAIFNLIPIGPLDGSKILVGLLPDDLAYEF